MSRRCTTTSRQQQASVRLGSSQRYKSTLEAKRMRRAKSVFERFAFFLAYKLSTPITRAIR